MREKITETKNPHRVERILSKICLAKLPLYLRLPNDAKVMIRARSELLTRVPARGDDIPSYVAMTISGISSSGIQVLKETDTIKVEFILRETKVYFISPVLSVGLNAATILLPEKLVSIERRKNVRYNTNEKAMGFLRSSLVSFNRNDLTVPPTFSIYKKLDGLLPLSDISAKGFCISTEFPFLTGIEKDMVDKKATLLFPMQKPIEVTFIVRWVKKLTDHIEIDSKRRESVTTYLYGCEFLGTHDLELELGINRFIEDINQSQAI